MEMGESDEGEPWFVLCSTETGDVLVHVAVIDRTYHIAGGWFPLIRGSSLNHVVHRFMSRQPAFLMGASGDDTVLLHPSSVIIVVFAAICLVSEEYYQDARGFAGRDRVLRADGGRSDPDIFNIADHRQPSLGDFTFTPQQAFIILSAIAFSASPFVQNNVDRLPETVDVVASVVAGASATKQDFDKIVSGLWEWPTTALDQESAAFRSFSEEIVDRQPQRSDVDVVAAEHVLLSSFEMSELPELAEDLPALLDMEPLAQGEQEHADMEIETDEIDEELLIPVVDPVVEADSGDITLQVDRMVGLFDRTFDGLGYKIETTEDGLSFSPSNAEPGAATAASVFISFASLAELAPYFELFEDRFGDAEVYVEGGRWIVTNQVALDAFAQNTGQAGPILFYELDGETPVYIMGVSQDLSDFSLIA